MAKNRSIVKLNVCASECREGKSGRELRRGQKEVVSEKEKGREEAEERSL